MGAKETIDEINEVLNITVTANEEPPVPRNSSVRHYVQLLSKTVEQREKAANQDEVPRNDWRRMVGDAIQHLDITLDLLGWKKAGDAVRQGIYATHDSPHTVTTSKK